MKSITVIFFTLSSIFFLATCKYIFDLKRPGVYPPKQVLKKRLTALAGGGGICLLFGLVLSHFYS